MIQRIRRWAAGLTAGLTRNEVIALILGISVYFTAFVAGVIGFFCVLFLLLDKTNRQKLNVKLLLPIIVASLAGIMGGVLSYFLPNTIGGNILGVLGLLAVALPCFLLYFILKDSFTQKAFFLLLRIIAVLGILNALISLIQLAGMPLNSAPRHELRTWGLFHNPNLFAHGLALSMVTIGGAVVCRLDKQAVYLYLAALGIMLVALVFTYCRTVWLALAVAALLFLLLCRQYWLFLLGVCACAVALFLISAGINVVPRVDLIVSEWGIRDSIYEHAFEGFTKSPVIGYGMFGYRLLYNHGTVIHAHNMLLNFLVDFGAVGTLGLGVFLWQMLSSQFRLWRTCQKNKPASPQDYYFTALPLSLLAYTLVHGLADVTGFNVQNGYLFLLIAAASMAVAKANSQNLLNAVKAGKN